MTATIGQPREVFATRVEAPVSAEPLVSLRGVSKAFKSGTGLARPEIFNWQTEYPAMLAGAKPDVVVVAIGANDGQGFVDNSVVYPFGSDGWMKIYEQRLTDFLAMLAQGVVEHTPCA